MVSAISCDSQGSLTRKGCRTPERRTSSRETSHSSHRIKKSLSRKTLDEDDKHFIVDSFWFQTIVNMMVFLNALQMGFEADHPELSQIWLVCENVFTAGFTAEMTVKLCVLKCKYFKDPANGLDCIVTVLGIFDCWVMAAVGSAAAADLQSLSILRILRLARLVRLLKLIRSVKPFVLVIRGVARAMQTAVYVFALCAIIFYVFSIFATQYLGRGTEDLYPGFTKEATDIDEQDFLADYNPYVCFGSMLSSMLTLFNISIMAEWTEIVRPIALKQPMFLPIFFVFAAFVSFGVMSVLIAAIVDVVNEESKKLEMEYANQELEHKMKVLQSIEDLLFELDLDGSGELDLHELEQAFQHNEFLEALLKDINLPAGWPAVEFRDMLDFNGDRSLQRDEFQAGLFRMMNSDESQHFCIMAASINQVKKMIRDQDRTHSAILSDIASIKSALGIKSELRKQKRSERLSTQSAFPVKSYDEEENASVISGTSDQQTNAFPAKKEEITMTPTTKASLGSTFTFPSSGVNEFTSSSQIEEALSAALMVVKECIHEEFAAIKPSLESEVKRCGAQKCSSPVEVASPPSGPMQHPAACEKPMASHSRRTANSQVDSFTGRIDALRSGETFSKSLSLEPSPRPKQKCFGL